LGDRPLRKCRRRRGLGDREKALSPKAKGRGSKDFVPEEEDGAIRKCWIRRRLECREKAENRAGSPKVGFIISILYTKEQL